MVLSVPRLAVSAVPYIKTGTVERRPRILLRVMHRLLAPAILICVARGEKRVAVPDTPDFNQTWSFAGRELYRAPLIAFIRR